ncbi:MULTISPECIES: Crp/Fnr family transcriptional regulator [Ramlibacter]|uniref:Cyclic nucleotide-binding domain-containing protein n=1 Tax=Ramlibacter pinisoli TaxID=2682844 RepID=A0A6N8IPL0_9BURK|nr:MULTISPECIES: Crp/Fnr family transcriptional regulator [Ramlibacter]MBA2963116.1 Crp/Fnr family transcriptional regulator [Ramlibacter sp. CGMCC 1.13660]MVQ28086.1 cyclic nucleotide-binding domain-containing protein [Ramlibacter pinisoli]
MSAPMPPSSLGLRTLELLQGLPPQRLDEISRQCLWRRFEPGQLLIAREHDDRDLHLIVAGAVRVTSYAPGGRETSFRDLQAGMSFGELSALDGRPRSADVIGLRSGLIASLPPAAFRALLQQEWTVTERVLLRLTDLARSLIDRVLDLSTLSVQQRVCLELLRLAQAAGVDGNQARIEPAPKHADLAHLVSSYREQVTRELSALAKAGVVARQDGALVVRDLERLKHIANREVAH